MKNAKFILILPMFALASCTQAAVSTSQVPSSSGSSVTPLNEVKLDVRYEDGIPHVQKAGSPSSHVTYLMMSPFGSLNVAGEHVKGEVSELFYENTIVWEADAGSALPISTIEVVTSVSGASFRGWAYYSDDSEDIFPTYYQTVPSQSGLALKAIFDGTTSSGGGSGGSGGGGGVVQTGYGLAFEDGTKIAGTSKGTNMDGKDEYLISGVDFKAGDKFQAHNYSTGVSWIANFSFNQWSFGSSGDGANISNYLEKDGDYWKALRDFKADVYIQLMFENDTIYFELK